MHHDYLSFYERFLAPMRDQPITLLEIGVFQGASLHTWREFFPKAKIIGVDIQATCKQFESERIKIELADQSNLEHLSTLALTYGPFDLVVEDGSHMWEHQITSLRALFPFIKNGGHYIVEDLQTNYGSMQARYRGSAAEPCTTFLKRWMDLFVADDSIDLQQIEDPFLRTYGRSIEFMAFHRRACVIRKRFTPTDWKVSTGSGLAPRAADALTVVVNAHIGMRGDIFGPRGYVDEGSDQYTIQGFALESEIGAVEYRVRFPDGAWSDWVGEGMFAGTRGHALPIIGFSVRIAERLADRFGVIAHGLFVGGAKVEKLSGEDCIAPMGADLRGLQVIVRPTPAPTPAPTVEAPREVVEQSRPEPEANEPIELVAPH
jgi:hypothetical protein